MASWQTACAALTVAVLAQSAFAAELPQAPEAYFGDWRGCALAITRDRHDETRFVFGPEQCQLPQSPCSTFKIPNALIGLQTGTVSGPSHLKEWDGTMHERTQNNQDHDLASAMKHSVVWYFQDMARDIGTEAMQSWLDRLEYGNQDISSGIDRFWLSASMKVSAQQQLDLVTSLKHQVLPFRPAVQQQVSDLLRQETKLPGTLYAKTGSCRGFDGEPDHGWFIGWVDWDRSTATNPASTLFVINIRGQAAWGWHAKSIAETLLADLQNLE